MELRVAHQARVRVGEGQVANVGLVRLRQGHVAGVDALDGLAQLEVERDDHDAVNPLAESIPWQQLFAL